MHAAECGEITNVLYNDENEIAENVNIIFITGQAIGLILEKNYVNSTPHDTEQIHQTFNLTFSAQIFIESYSGLLVFRALNQFLLLFQESVLNG